MVRTSEQPAEGASQALWSSTIAFTVCFAVWTIFSIIGLGVKDQLGLTETEFGLLVGTPILTGSLTRVVLGVWADQFGGRRVFAAVMVLGAIATFLTSYAHTYPQLLIAALGVGVAGGAFSVGVTYVSKFYPKEKQGLALGIFGAGNVGAAVTKFLAPFVMVAMGWQAVAQIWAADKGFSGGTVYAVNSPVAGAKNPALYQTLRWQSGTFRYQFAAPNGVYTVNLKFAEIYFTRAGQRRFSVAINGQTALLNFDIIAAAGGPGVAIDRSFQTTATNGSIVIQFDRGDADDPQINALEILH